MGLLNRLTRIGDFHFGSTIIPAAEMDPILDGMRAAQTDDERGAAIREMVALMDRHHVPLAERGWLALLTPPR